MRQVAVRYDRDERGGGQTNYQFGHMLLLAIDAITSFSTRPLHIASLVGLWFRLPRVPGCCLRRRGLGGAGLNRARMDQRDSRCDDSGRHSTVRGRYPRRVPGPTLHRSQAPSAVHHRSGRPPGPGPKAHRMKSPEFDRYADSYRRLHSENIRITGESPDYFARYKAKHASRLATGRLPVPRILDFGCGIGNATPYLREYFPDCEITGTERLAGKSRRRARTCRRINEVPRHDRGCDPCR